MTASNPNQVVQVLEWLAANFHILGWIALLGFLWRGFRFINDLSTRATAAEAHITKMATNCFPTMQTSLQTQDVLLKGIAGSMTTQDGLLHSIDGSLKTLARRKSKRDD